MIVYFKNTATHAQIAELQLHLKQLGLDSQLVPGQNICLVNKLKDEKHKLILKKFDQLILY